MKHYGQFLPWAGRSVKYKTDDLVRLHLRREDLVNQLEQLHKEIDVQESEFEEYIRDEWSEEEVEEAKQRSYEYNTEKRISQ